MSKLSEMIIDILENPFFFSEILTFCSSYYNKREMSIYEAYLIIAIFMNKDSYNLFLNTNAKGTLQNKMLGNSDISFLLTTYIENYKNNINKGVLIVLTSNSISYNSKECTIKYIGKKLKNNYFDSENEKVLKNIVKIFEKYDYKDIFKLLGVTSI